MICGASDPRLTSGMISAPMQTTAQQMRPGAFIGSWLAPCVGHAISLPGMSFPVSIPPPPQRPWAFFVSHPLPASSLIASLALLVGQCFAAVSSAPPQTPQQAYEQLRSIKCFAFGGVGYAGTTSKGEVAFRAVAASTNGLQLLTTTLTNGTVEAKLYA